MHTTALVSGQQFFDVYCPGLIDAAVVDIGSQDVNGSLKDVCPATLSYIGVDFVAGEGVDIVLDDPYKLPFGDETIDIVVCSSCFEHSEMFWLLFIEILRILRPSGLFYLNVPSNGAFHRYPVDCWRFYPDSGHALITWAIRQGFKPVLLESFTTKQNGDIWNDYVAVFLKDARCINRYPRRMMRSRSDYYNGSVNGKPAVRRPQRFSEDEILSEQREKALAALKLECDGLRSERDALLHGRAPCAPEAEKIFP